MSHLNFPQITIIVGSNGPACYVGNRLAFPQQVVHLNSGQTHIRTIDLVRLHGRDPACSLLEAARAKLYVAFHEAPTERRQA